MVKMAAEEAEEVFLPDRVVVLVARLALLLMDPTVPMAVAAVAAHHRLVAGRGRSTRPRDQHRSSRAASSSPLEAQ